MNKKSIVKLESKTHAYIISDGTVVRAISETHVDAYQKDGVTVYSTPATKTVDGVKTDVLNYYVPVANFVKRTSSRASAKDKLANAIAGIDITGKTAEQVLAELQAMTA